MIMGEIHQQTISWFFLLPITFILVSHAHTHSKKMGNLNACFTQIIMACWLSFFKPTYHPHIRLKLFICFLIFLTYFPSLLLTMTLHIISSLMVIPHVSSLGTDPTIVSIDALASLHEKLFFLVISPLMRLLSPSVWPHQMNLIP